MKKQSPLKRIFAIRGMGGALTAFAGLIIIYIAFGICLLYTSDAADE